MIYKSLQQNFRAANELQMSLTVKDFVNVSRKLEIKTGIKCQDRCFLWTLIILHLGGKSVK